MVGGQVGHELMNRSLKTRLNLEKQLYGILSPVGIVPNAHRLILTKHADYEKKVSIAVFQWIALGE
jgi:hypothetical protein